MSVVQTQRGIEQRAQHTTASLVFGYVALAVLPIIILLTLCVILPPNALNGPIEDDAYYYARIAKNLAQGNGSTFGGLVLTNGYHPLWQIILALLHYLTKNEDHFIFLVMIVSCLSWVACVELLRRIGILCGAQASFLLAGLYAVYLLTHMTPGSPVGLLFLGMESTLAVPLLLGPVSPWLLAAPVQLGRRGRPLGQGWNDMLICRGVVMHRVVFSVPGRSIMAVFKD